jgi:hypothetical protein
MGQVLRRLSSPASPGCTPLPELKDQLKVKRGGTSLAGCKLAPHRQLPSGDISVTVAGYYCKHF